MKKEIAKTTSTIGKKLTEYFGHLTGSTHQEALNKALTSMGDKKLLNKAKAAYDSKVKTQAITTAGGLIALPVAVGAMNKQSSSMQKVSAFKNELTKLAVSSDMMSFLKYLGTGLAVSAGLGAVAAGTTLGINAYQQHKLDSSKQPLFDQMLQLHPELKENKLRASLYFDTLWHYSPIIAQNPLSAGAYIRQALQMDSVAGGPLPQMVKELTEISKSHAQSRQNLPSSPMGIMFSGITEAPKKALPSFMTYDQSGFAPPEPLPRPEPAKKVDHTHTHIYPNP